MGDLMSATEVLARLRIDAASEDFEGAQLGPVAVRKLLKHIAALESDRWRQLCRIHSNRADALRRERDELAVRLAQIAAQPPERPLYPFNVPLGERIAENAQAVTTGGDDKGDYFEVPAHLMAALALALDEWPGAQGQAGAASMGTKIRPAAAPDRAELAQAREVLRSVEWLPGDLRPDEPRWCMVCMSYEPHHAPDCKLNAALAAKE